MLSVSVVPFVSVDRAMECIFMPCFFAVSFEYVAKSHDQCSKMPPFAAT